MTVIDYLVLMVEHLLAQLHFNEFLSFYGLFLAVKEPVKYFTYRGLDAAENHG